MNEDRKIIEGSQKGVHSEDEIELIDIVRVIWKWKYFILTGTIVCALIAAVICYNMTKVYSISMVLRPGISKLGDNGNDVYIDSLKNIKSLIDSGIFNKDILNYLHDTSKEKVPKKLIFKVTIPEKSNTLSVKYDTANTNQGLVIQDRLVKLLLEKYSKRVQYFRYEYDLKLNLLKNETTTYEAAIRSHKRNIKNVEKRIDELAHEIELAKTNTVDLVGERRKLLSKSLNENNIISTLVYTNTIQQNLQLLNNYQNEINNYKQKIEDELQDIEQLKNKIADNSIEKNSLQTKINSIENIKLIQAPTKSSYPIKPKTLLIVTLATIIGLFLTICYSFFSEYIITHKKRIHIVSNGTQI